MRKQHKLDLSKPALRACVTVFQHRKISIATRLLKQSIQIGVAVYALRITHYASAFLTAPADVLRV
jgi:hypothetical protein